MGTRNNAYDEMDVNEETKKKFYDNCIRLVENMNNEKLEERDGNTVQTVESSNLEKVEKDKKSRIVGAAVAVFAVGSIATMMAVGMNYLKSNNSSVAKEKTTNKMSETTTIADYGSFYDSYLVDEEEIKEMYEYVDDSDDCIYNTDIVNLCYDKNGKLKNGYEEKEFILPSSNKKITLVGKDFVVITKDEVRKNADVVTERYLSGIDDHNLDKTKTVCEKNANEFCSYDYVYYIQGEYLVRTKLDKDGTTVCESGMKYLGLSKMGTEVLIHEEYFLDANDERVDNKYLLNLKVFDYYKNIGKEKYDSEEYGNYSFRDINILGSESIKLFDKKDRKLLARIDAYEHVYSVQDGKIVLYYIDVNNDLWRISDVSAFDTKSVKPVDKNVTCDSLLHSKDIFSMEFATGVDSNYKAEKIAKKVDVNSKFWYRTVDDKVEPFEQMSGFEKLIDDEHITYMNHDDYEQYMSDTNENYTR